jgi:glycolate oxidase FAD binding subunit
MGGEIVPGDKVFWADLREQKLAAFTGDTLWRLSISAATAPLQLPGRQVIEWNGALRWIATDAPATSILAAARKAGGHASHYRGRSPGEPLFELDATTLALHKRLKAALDPDGIFGRHRLHPDF